MGSNQQQQQQQPANIFTIHETHLNNGQRQHNIAIGNDILIDTSSSMLVDNADQAGFPVEPIQAQPGANSARVAPEHQNVVYSVHPIFNLLDQHEQLLIRQKAHCQSTCCGFESTNTYTVRSNQGLALLKAVETSNCFERCCFEGNREYDLSLVHGDEVVARIRKPYRVSRFCCYTNAVRIESPEDNPIGYVRQLFSLFGHPRYAIFDCQQPPKKPSFYLQPVSCRFCFTLCLCSCLCGNSQFKVVSYETRQEVAIISRRLPEPIQLQATAMDEQQPFGAPADQEALGASTSGSPLGSFGVQFTQSEASNPLEARQKLLILSACFMMDFFYFENDRRRKKLASC